MKVSPFFRKSASNFIVQVKQHSSPSFFIDTNGDLFSIIRLGYILASKKETKILAVAGKYWAGANWFLMFPLKCLFIESMDLGSGQRLWRIIRDNERVKLLQLVENKRALLARQQIECCHFLSPSSSGNMTFDDNGFVVIFFSARIMIRSLSLSNNFRDKKNYFRYISLSI